MKHSTVKVFFTYVSMVSLLFLLAIGFQFVCTLGTVNIYSFSFLNWALEIAYLSLAISTGALLAEDTLKPKQ